MPVPVIGLGLGAGALWLLSQLGGSKSAQQTKQSSATPKSEPVNPNIGGGGLSADEKWAISLGVSATPVVIGIGSTIAKAIAAAATGGSQQAGGSGAVVAEEGVAVAASTGSSITSGVLVEAIGGSVALIGIVAAIVAGMVADAVVNFQTALTSFFAHTGDGGAPRFFNLFMSKIAAANISPTSLQLQQIVRTSLFLEYTASNARNSALLHFYGATGQGIPAPGTAPIGGEVLADLWGTEWMRWVGTPPRPFGNRQTTLTTLTNPLTCFVGAKCDYDLINAAVTSPGELRAAAMALLGDHFAAAEALQVFTGKTTALAFAATQLYNFGVYPGDQKLVSDLRDTVVPEWSIDNGSYWTADRQMQTAVWLVDPVTGSRFAPAETRRQWKMVVSVKGMQVSPGVLAGFSGRRVVSGRRFAGSTLAPVRSRAVAAVTAGAVAPNGSSQCINPDTGEFITCAPPITVATLDPRKAPPTSGSSGLAALAVPAIGLGALLFFGLGLGGKRG